MWEKLRPVVSVFVIICLAFWLAACGGKGTKLGQVKTLSISEISPPAEIQRLNRFLDRYMPQVSIISPQPDEVLATTDVTIGVAVRDLPLFKSGLGLGPHLDVVLDDREHAQVYDTNQPIVLNNVSPGTHTLRVFASRPWDESFKNEGAYAQTTFHVLTRTGEHIPRSDTPLLTYHSPMGSSTTDTVLLDFYLHNAPVPTTLLDSKEASNWQIRTTINGESFTIDDWHSLYLKGLKPGKNWIKLEFLDPLGNAIPNIGNSIAELVNYEPTTKDILSQLLEGATIPDIDQIVDPTYLTAKIAPPPIEEPIIEAPVVTEPIKPIEVVPPEPVEATTEEQVPSPPPTEKVEKPAIEKPAKSPRFQFFKSKAKVTPPVVTPAPQEVVPPAPESNPIELAPTEPIGQFEKVKEPQIEEPIIPAATPTFDTIPPDREEAKEKETIIQNRFQSLKSRFQRNENSPVEVPIELPN